MNRTRLPGCVHVNALAFLPSGELLATSRSGLFRGGIDGWEALVPLEYDGAYRCLQLAADPLGRFAAYTWVVRHELVWFAIFDLARREVVARLSHPWNDDRLTSSYLPVHLAFTPDGGEFHARRGETLRWSVPGWRMLDALPPRWSGWGVESPRGHVFADSMSLRSWVLTDPNGGTVRREKRGTTLIRIAAFTPDSRTLLFRHRQHFRRLDADTGEELPPRDWGIQPLTALAISADGLTAAQGTGNGVVLAWDEG